MSFGNRIRLWASLTPLAAVLFLAACDESPTSEGAGEPFAIDASSASTRQVVGVQFRVDARSLDRGLTPLPAPVEVTPSGSSLRVDSLVFAAELQESRIYVTPTAFDTTAFLVISSGGAQDTVYVNALPGSIVATIAADTIQSGTSTNITVHGISGTGVDLGEVPFVTTSSPADLVSVNGAVVTGKDAGTARIVLGGPGGSLRDTVEVTIVPGTFTGTVTAGAVDAGEEITITAGEGEEFDDDTQVLFPGDDDGAFITSRTADEIVAVVPFGAAGNTFLITDAGANDVSLEGTYTLGSTADSNEPNDNPLTAPLVALGDTYSSVTEDDVDDFYTLTVTTAGTYTIKVEWLDDADIDLYVLNATADLNACGDDFIACGGATASNPEGGEAELPVGTYRIYVNLWESSGASTTYRLSVTRN